MQLLAALVTLALSQLSVALQSDANGEAVAIDTSAFMWETATSANGNSFVIGRPKVDSVDVEARSEQDKRPFTVAVTWKPDNDKWKPTTDKLTALTGITRYALYKTSLYPKHSGFYAYCLDFTNLEHYDYHFQDKTGDRYGVNTFRNGDHYVCYDSANPTIINVDGS